MTYYVMRASRFKSLEFCSVKTDYQLHHKDLFIVIMLFFLLALFHRFKHFFTLSWLVGHFNLGDNIFCFHIIVSTHLLRLSSYYMEEFIFNDLLSSIIT